MYNIEQGNNGWWYVIDTRTASVLYATTVPGLAIQARDALLRAAKYALN